MDFNLTLIGQTISMVVFVWICMKWIWPYITEEVIEKRRRIIADGIAAGERGQKELAEARHGSEAILADARQKAMQVTDLASKRGNDLVNEAKNVALAEGQRLVSQARGEIANEQDRARDGLRKEVSALALAGAAKVLGREVDAKAHAQLLDELAAELEKGAPARG
jgi:F-type H+-transporting ATPase subunit b